MELMPPCCVSIAHPGHPPAGGRRTARLQLPTQRKRDRATQLRNNPAEKMKLPLLAAVALSGGGCPIDAFVPKVGVLLTSTTRRVEPWAAAKSAQPRGGGVRMKSQATSVKVEVSLGAILRPLGRTACQLGLVIPCVVCQKKETERERHAERSRRR